MNLISNNKDRVSLFLIIVLFILFAFITYNYKNTEKKIGMNGKIGVAQINKITYYIKNQTIHYSYINRYNGKCINNSFSANISSQFNISDIYLIRYLANDDDVLFYIDTPLIYTDKINNQVIIDGKLINKYNIDINDRCQ